MTSKESFVSAVEDQFGFSRFDAERVYNIFKRDKLLVDKHDGSYTLEHWALWDVGVMRGALYDDTELEDKYDDPIRDV